MVLARYPLYVAVPPQHPFAEFHSLKREQLADEIFISYRQNALSEYDPAIWQEKNTNPALTKFVECIQEEMPMSLKSIS